jgi:hypothetical protein
LPTRIIRNRRVQRRKGKAPAWGDRGFKDGSAQSIEEQHQVPDNHNGHRPGYGER